MYLCSYQYPNHPLTFPSGELKNLPEEIVNLLKDWEVEFADEVLIAYDQNVIAGFFRYDLGDIEPWLYDAGTYVNPDYRNQGLAFGMWEKILMEKKSTRVFAHITSAGGLKIIHKIKNHYSNVKFDLTFDRRIEL